MNTTTPHPPTTSAAAAVASGVAHSSAPHSGGGSSGGDVPNLPPAQHPRHARLKAGSGSAGSLQGAALVATAWYLGVAQPFCAFGGGLVLEQMKPRVCVLV